MIYDAIGRVSATLPTDMEHVMLENLATGTYFVVATGKRVVTTSFVVTR
ncbi:MAG: T9SS type A sorting domain-containing protein ['Candidatus Kapabacteria' thiocyanatum]|nr:T9SS type A sorting domain-containing protein ['Candidatus Kapabacteria' thiocyanatum]